MEKYGRVGQKEKKKSICCRETYCLLLPMRRCKLRARVCSEARFKQSINRANPARKPRKEKCVVPIIQTGGIIFIWGLGIPMGDNSVGLGLVRVYSACSVLCRLVVILRTVLLHI